MGIDRNDFSKAPCGTTGFKSFNDFRGVILRAIAAAWTDTSFRVLLEEKPIEALKTRFGYEFPYDLDVTCNRNSAEYKPELVNDWRARRFDTITIMLPPAPDENHRANALAAYNWQHMTFLRAKIVPSRSDVLALLSSEEGKAAVLEILKEAKHKEGSKQ